ncbi:AfsR/SARP family transcriptional regulator [Streptomyces sp. NPDC089919]|uniref:AfsR/SARP family transcriptional regulator n=1 Tax=Streptomyces sp. NPDC089919 TaxID=3155188 RepID=UPI003414989B
MEIGLLGPLVVSLRGRPGPPTAAKQRTLLALLALHSGQLVLTDSIIDELWGEEPVTTAAATVRTYIFQIRKLIGPAEAGEHPDPGPEAEAGAGEAGGRREPQEILRAVPGGYVLHPDRPTDAQRYEREVAAGREALAGGDYEAAGRRFRAALGLWRGAALMDVRRGSRLQAAARRLEESRLLVLEYRVEADLQLGRHRELLGELSGLCAEHPLHEGLHALYMLALHRSGRRSEALAVYRRLRIATVENLGLEPSSRVQGLQQEILRSGGGPGAPGGPGAAELTALVLDQSRRIAELTSRIARIEERLGLDGPELPAGVRGRAPGGLA